MKSDKKRNQTTEKRKDRPADRSSDAGQPVRKGDRKKGAPGKRGKPGGKAPAVPRIPDARQAFSLGKKLQLEQSITGLVGGRTGTFALLNMMFQSAEHGDAGAFSLYAESFHGKCGPLKTRVKEYTDYLEQFREKPGSPAGFRLSFGSKDSAEANRTAVPPEEDPRLRPTDELPLYKLMIEIGEDLERFLPPAEFSRGDMEDWRNQYWPLFLRVWGRKGRVENDSEEKEEGGDEADE